MNENLNLIQLPHLKVQNANALSSPFTIGFPAMTAWLGFMHALERKLNALPEQSQFPAIKFYSLAVISHDCQLQVYKGSNDFVYSIIGTGNPLDKDGGRPAFIEEARCHLDVSLLIEYQINGNAHETLPDNPQILACIRETIMKLKLAGGDILSMDTPKLPVLAAREKEGLSKKAILNSLMPGYALIERRDLMESAMEAGQDAMDALLDHVTVENVCVMKDNGDFEWKTQRKSSGWLVPIATGFQGISPLGKALNQRDPDAPHRFAESIVTLGQFIMVNKADSIPEILWENVYSEENDLYLCEQVESKFFTNGE